MAQSQIEQTRISGGAASDPKVVEIVRAALLRATQLLDDAVPSVTLTVKEVRVGAEVDPDDPSAVESLAKLIALEALKQLPADDANPPIPSSLSAGGSGVTVASTSPFATSDPTPKALLLDPSFSGGVRGKLKEAYRRKGGDASLNRIDDKITNTQAGLVARTNLYRATVTHLSKESDHVQIKVTVGSEELVVRVYSEPEPPPAGPLSEGEETGPVRFFPTLSATGRLVGGRVGVDEDLDRRDMVRALGNEVDLVAGLLKDGHLTREALLREMRAEMMQGDRAPKKPTVQDFASAAELEEVWKAFKISDAKKKLPKSPAPTDAEIQAERVRVLTAKLQAWGLIGQDQHIGSKIDFLQQRLDKGVLNELTRGLYFAGRTTPSAFTSQEFGHLIEPEENLGNTLSYVRGGHLDGALLRCAAESDRLELIEIGALTVGGLKLRRYAQLKWTGTLPKPAPGSSDYPTVASGTVTLPGTGWQRSTEDKTTFEDLMAFVKEAESAWAKFIAGGGTPAPVTGLWSEDSNKNVPIKGYAHGTAPDYEFASLFPDASKI